MDFELTPDQVELQAAARSVLEGACPPSLVREVTETGKGADGLWATLCELDWPGLALPVEHGGLGQTWVELAVVLEELGRAAAPGPFLATVTQFAPLITAAGTPAQVSRWVGEVAAGSLTGTIAIDEGSGTWRAADVQAKAVADGDGFVLSGRKRFVLDGDRADEIVVVARIGGELGFFVVPGADVVASPLAPIDAATCHADIDLTGVRVDGERRLTGVAPGGADLALEGALEEAATAVAISTVGACQEVLDRVVAYAREREQFGVPIGSFQAVKHKLVDMYRDVERARALGYFAALCFAEGDDRRSLAAAMAKAAAGECQARVVQDGLQLFGGIGYTWENDLHLFLRRAKVGELHLGSAAQHRCRVAKLFLEQQRTNRGS